MGTPNRVGTQSVIVPDVHQKQLSKQRKKRANRSKREQVSDIVSGIKSHV